MPTLLEILSEPNPKLDVSGCRHGPNTEASGFFSGHVEPWREFTYKRILKEYGDVLALETRRVPPQWASELDHKIFSEATMDDLIRREVVPVVNAAVEVACRHLRCKPLHIGRGDRCAMGLDVPDWSVVFPGLMSSARVMDRYRCVIPGDTKLGSKWRSSLKEMGNSLGEWAKPITQILNYMSTSRSSIGWIITDRELVIFWNVHEEVSGGLAADRPRRDAPQGTLGHRRGPSGSSDASVSTASAHASDSSYDDKDDLESTPRIVVIPWTNRGREGLTVKLGLFATCMMALTSDISRESRNNPLDRPSKRLLGLDNLIFQLKQLRLPTRLRSVDDREDSEQWGQEIEDDDGGGGEEYEFYNSAGEQGWEAEGWEAQGWEAQDEGGGEPYNMHGAQAMLGPSNFEAEASGAGAQEDMYRFADLDDEVSDATVVPFNNKGKDVARRAKKLPKK